MGLGQNWGVTVAIDIAALRTFEKSSKALATGAARIGEVGKAANTLISNLGQNLSSQVNAITGAISKLENVVNKARTKAGSAGTGSDGGSPEFVFPRVNQLPRGAKRINAVDEYMSKQFGMMAGQYKANMIGAKQTGYSALAGSFPRPNIRGPVDNREKYYTGPQAQAMIMKESITRPLLNAMEKMKDELVAALGKVDVKYGGVPAEKEKPVERKIKNVEKIIEDVGRKAAAENRGPRPPSQRQMTVSSAPQSRANESAEFSRLAAINVANFSRAFRESLSQSLLGIKFESNKGLKDLIKMPLSALPNALAARGGLSDEQSGKKLKNFFRDTNIQTDIVEPLARALQKDPMGLTGSMTSDRSGKRLSAAQQSSTLGQVLDQLHSLQTGGKSASGKDIYSILEKTYTLEFRKIKPALEKIAQAEDAMSRESKAPPVAATAPKKRRRTTSESLTLETPTEDEGSSRKKISSTAQTPGKFRGAMDRVVNWGSAAVLVYGGAQQISESIKQMASFETAINRVRRNMNPLAADFFKVADGARKLGEQFGFDINEVATTMATFAKQGEDVNSVLADTKIALLAVNTTDLTLIEATDGLISAQKEFLLGTGNGLRILDSWNAVEKISAISATSLADATKQAGTASRSAGVDFDSFNGIVAAVGETTRKSGETIGTSLKYIFQHMRDVKSVESLQQIGVFSEDQVGNFKTARQVLGEVAQKWDHLTDAERSNVAISVAGTEHLNDFIVMMETWDRAIDLSVVSMTSQGSTMKANQIVMEGLEKHVDQLKASFQGLFAEMGEAGVLDMLKAMADTTREILGMFSGLNKAAGGLPASILGNAALVGGLGAAASFGGRIVHPAIFGNHDTEEEPEVATSLRKRRNPRTRTTSSSELPIEEEEAAEVGMMSRLVPGRSRKIGMGLMLGGAALQYGYNASGMRQALPGQAPSGRDASVNILSSGLETAGLIGTLGGAKKMLGGGMGGKALLAAIVTAGVMKAYQQYNEYKKGSDVSTEDGAANHLQSLQAWQDKISTTKGDVRMLMRQTSGDESNADVDMSKVQSVRDTLAAIDPALASSATSAQEFLKQLKDYPDRLDAISAKLRQESSSIIGNMVSAELSSPQVQSAKLRIDELQNQQQKQNLGESVDDHRARISRASEIGTNREVLNGVFNRFRGQMLNTGHAGMGMGNQDFGGIASGLGMDKEDVARAAVQEYLHGMLGYQPKIDKQLNDAGVKASDVHYYQAEKSGPVYDLATHNEVDKKTVGNSFVLEATASNAQAEVAVTQAQNLHKLVDEYSRAIESLIGKNDDLLKNVDSVNAAIASMSFMSPEMMAGGRGALQGSGRTISALNDISANGAKGFSTVPLTGSRDLQNALTELIGEVTLQGKNPHGIGPSGDLDAAYALEDLNGSSLKGLGHARDTLLKTGGNAFNDNFLNDPQNAGEIGGEAESSAYKKLRETIGPDATSVLADIAKDYKKASDSHDGKGADALAEKFDRVLSGAYKAPANNEVRKVMDNARAFNDQAIAAGQNATQQLGIGYSRALSTGQAKNVDQYLSGPEASALRDGLKKLSDQAKELVEKQQKRVDQLGSTPEGKLSDEFKNASDTLAVFKTQMANLSDQSENLTSHVGNLVVGMDVLNTAISRVKNQAGFGGAFGQTGIQGDKYGVEVLTRELTRLGDELTHTKDPQEQGKIQKQIDEYRDEVTRRNANIDMTKDYRSSLGEGLQTNVLAARLSAAVGLPVENAIGEWRQSMIDSFHENLQQISKDLSPAMAGKGPESMRAIVEQMRPLLMKMGGNVHDLALDGNNEYRKQYLLASPSQRIVADSIRNQIKQGIGADQIFSDPYTRGAAASNPMLGQLMDQALENQDQERALQYQSDIANNSKQSNDWLKQIYDLINGQRQTSGLAPVAPPSPAGRLAVGSMAKAGTGNIDPQGRIKRDWTPAYLDKGEVVLNSTQSEHYLATRNRFASGTIPLNISNYGNKIEGRDGYGYRGFDYAQDALPSKRREINYRSVRHFSKQPFSYGSAYEIEFPNPKNYYETGTNQSLKGKIDRKNVSRIFADINYFGKEDGWWHKENKKVRRLFPNAEMIFTANEEMRELGSHISYNKERQSKKGFTSRSVSGDSLSLINIPSDVTDPLRDMQPGGDISNLKPGDPFYMVDGSVGVFSGFDKNGMPRGKKAGSNRAVPLKRSDIMGAGSPMSNYTPPSAIKIKTRGSNSIKDFDVTTMPWFKDLPPKTQRWLGNLPMDQAEAWADRFSGNSKPSPLSAPVFVPHPDMASFKPGDMVSYANSKGYIKSGMFDSPTTKGAKVLSSSNRFDYIDAANITTPIQKAVEQAKELIAATDKVTGFTTAKGSTYTWNNGVSQRNKSLHAGHDPRDVGLKPASQKTVFVQSVDAQEIGMHGALNKEAYPGVKYTENGIVLSSHGYGPHTGKRYTKTIPFTTEPAVGLAPVEFFDKGKYHPGTPIVALHTGATATSTPVTPVDLNLPPRVFSSGPVTEEMIRAASHEHQQLTFGEGKIKLTSLTKETGGALPGVQKSLNNALDIAANDAEKMGLTPDSFRSVSSLIDKSFGKLPTKYASKAGVLALHQGLQLDDNGNFVAADKITFRRVAGVKGSNIESGLVPLIKHEYQHALDQYWSPDIYKDLAPDDLQVLQKRVASLVLDKTMTTNSKSALQVKHAVRDFHGEVIDSKKTQLKSDMTFAREVQAYHAESGTLDAVDRAKNKLLAEGMIESREHLGNGNIHAHWDTLRKTLTSVEHLYTEHGARTDRPFDQQRAMSGTPFEEAKLAHQAAIDDGTIPFVESEVGGSKGTLFNGERAATAILKRKPKTRVFGGATWMDRIKDPVSGIAGIGMDLVKSPWSIARGIRNLPSRYRSARSGIGSRYSRFKNGLSSAREEFGWGFREGNGRGFAGRAGYYAGILGEETDVNRSANYRQMYGPSLRERFASGASSFLESGKNRLTSMKDGAINFGKNFSTEYRFGLEEGNGFGLAGKFGNLVGMAREQVRRPFSDEKGFSDWKDRWEGRKANRESILRSEAFNRSQREPSGFGKMLSSEMFAAGEMERGFTLNGGAHGGLMAAGLYALHTDTVKNWAGQHHLGGTLDYGLNTADAAFSAQMVGGLMRGESVTGLNILGGVSNFGRAGEAIGNAGRFAKMGIGRVLLPFEIANQSVNIAQAGNRIGHDLGWVGDNAYKNFSQTTDVAKHLIWSPFSETGGFAARTVANTWNYAHGQGYDSSMQKEHDYLGQGKAALKAQGISTWSQWDDDYMAAMKMKGAMEQGKANLNLKHSLDTPLLMLASKDELNAAFQAVKPPTSGGTSSDPAAAMRERYNGILEAIKVMTQNNAAYKEMTKSAGPNGFKDAQSNIEEGEKRVVALQDQADYLKTILNRTGINSKTSGNSGNGNMDEGQISAWSSVLSDDARQGLARNGVMEAFNQISSSFGLKDAVPAKWGDVAAEMVRNRPEATLLDLINAADPQHAQQDSNKALGRFLTQNADLGLGVEDPAKLKNLLTGPGADEALKKLKQDNQFGDLAGASALMNKEASQGTILTNYGQAMDALKAADIGGYKTSLTTAQAALDKLRTDSSYKWTPSALPSLIQEKLAAYNAGIGGVQKLGQDVDARWGGISTLASNANAAFHALPDGLQQQYAQMVESKANNVTPWKLLNIDEPTSPNAFRAALASLDNYATQAGSDQEKWANAKSAIDAKSDAETFLSRASRKPVLEQKKIAAFDPKTGTAIAGKFEFAARLKGDPKWRYGDDANALAKAAPQLTKDYNKQEAKSKGVEGRIGQYAKAMSGDKTLSEDEFWSKLAGPKGKDTNFAIAAMTYVKLQNQIADLQKNAKPDDVDQQTKLAQLTTDRDNTILDSGYAPAAFQQAARVKEQMGVEFARRAAEQKAAADKAAADAAQRVKDFEDRDQTPVFRPKRHTGGGVTASNEYVLQDTEGLVLTGSRMEQAVGMLGKIANQHTDSGSDDMQSLASQFMGRTPESNTLFHSHSGSVDVNLQGHADFYQSIAAAVGEHLGSNMGGGAPRMGDRIKKGYE